MIDRGWDLSVREELIAPCPLPAWKGGWPFDGEEGRRRSRRKYECHLHRQFPTLKTVSAWVMRRATDDTGGGEKAKTEPVIEEVKRRSQKGETVLKGCRTRKALLLPSPMLCFLSLPPCSDLPLDAPTSNLNPELNTPLSLPPTPAHPHPPQTIRTAQEAFIYSFPNI